MQQSGHQWQQIENGKGYRDTEFETGLSKFSKANHFIQNRSRDDGDTACTENKLNNNTVTKYSTLGHRRK